MKSYILHYKNKYPMGQVISRDGSLDVYDAEGEHCVALRMSGAGQWHDASAELGCKDCHDLSPIPKDARLYKEVDGKITKVEEYGARISLKDQFLSDDKLKVLSCAELAKAGKFKFDEKQRVEKI